MQPIEPITAMQALDYEIRSSRWAGFVGWPWLQAIAAWHFERKAKAKHRRYFVSVMISVRLGRGTHAFPARTVPPAADPATPARP